MLLFKGIFMTLLFSLFLILFAACDNKVGCGDIAPQVTPVLMSIGKDTVQIKWNEAGEAYYYNVLLGYDSIADNDFRNVASAIDSTVDTVITIRNLLPNTFYKIVVRTVGGDIAPNQSWPPLRFKTLE